MSKEEPSLGIVRISIRLTELVMNAMISGPDVDRVLHRYAVGSHQEEPQRQSGLVRAMSPKSMSTSSDTLFI